MLAACALVASRAALAQPAPPPPAPPAPASAQPVPAPQPGVAPQPVPAPQPGVAPQPVPAPQPPPGAAPPGAGAPQAPPGYPQYPGYYPYYYPPPGYYPGYPAAQDQPTKAPELRRKNPTMMAGGIALTFAGAAGLVVSAIVWSAGQNRYEIYCSPEFGGQPYMCREEDDEGLIAAGWIALGGSVAAMAVGIPLWVIGGKRVAVEPTPAAAPAARRPKVQPTVALGLGSARVRVEF